jgi:hypothetical protein
MKYHWVIGIHTYEGMVNVDLPVRLCNVVTRPSATLCLMCEAFAPWANEKGVSSLVTCKRRLIKLDGKCTNLKESCVGVHKSRGLSHVTCRT